MLYFMNEKWTSNTHGIKKLRKHKSTGDYLEMLVNSLCIYLSLIRNWKALECYSKIHCISTKTSHWFSANNNARKFSYFLGILFY